MKIKFCGLLPTLALLCLIAPRDAVAQSANAPFLSISNSVPPVLTINGNAGASYQIQFANQLTGANPWSALTNILLQDSNFALADTNAQSAAVRFYRALLLNAGSGNFTGYAPDQLTPGETYQFVASNGPTVITQTLVINSATDGVLVNFAGNQNTAIVPVSLQFVRLSPISASVRMIAYSGPTPVTNSFLLAFTNSNSGLYQGPLETPPTLVGNFTRGAVLVGQTPASQPLAAGEIWTFTNSPGLFTLQTLLLDSPTNGWWIVSGGGPGGGVFAVGVQFIPQSASSGNLVVTFAPGQNSANGSTNTYLVQFTATNSGSFQGPSESPGFPGSFVRDTGLTGKSPAPASLVPGETYRFAPNSGFSLQHLSVESATNAWYTPLGVFGSFPSLVDAQLTPLGPFSASVTFIVPPNQNNPFAVTNIYLLVFTTTNSGSFTSLQSGLPASGAFTRITTLVGQNPAPAQSSGGQIWRLQGDAGIDGSPSLYVNSSTDGIWVNRSPAAFKLAPVSLQYSRLSPIAGIVTIVFNPGLISPTPTTNTCMFIFTNLTSGFFTGILPTSPVSSAIGYFALDASQVGKSPAPPQLAAGESWLFAGTNGFLPAQPENLILSSPTNALWIVSGSGPNSGFFPATIQYTRLGPLGATLDVILPPGDNLPSGLTNQLLLAFDSTNHGAYQLTAPDTALQFSAFIRTLP